MTKSNSYSSRLMKIGYNLLCFLTSFFVLPLCFLIFGGLFLVRQAVKASLRFTYKGRFKLMHPRDASCNLNYDGSSVRFTACFFLRLQANEFNLEKLRTKINGSLDHCCSPYRKLKYRYLNKFGFSFWEDMSIGGSFNINEHVKYFPGSYNKIMTKNEMQSLLNDSANSSKGACERPDWEILVMPQVRMRSDVDNQQASYAALILQMNHAYMDGNCCSRFVQTCIMDGSETLRMPIDVMNKQGATQPTIFQKFAFTSRLLLQGPIYSLKSVLGSRRSMFLTTNQRNEEEIWLLASSKLNITSSAMTRIRIAFGCQTLSVITACFLSALQNTAEKKGMETPERLKVAFTHAKLPYSTGQPDNRFCLLIQLLPLAVPNQRQLAEIDKLLAVDEENGHVVDTMFWGLTMLGLLPSSMRRYLQKTMTGVSCGVTATPATEKLYKLQNGEVETILSFPPLVTGVDYTCGFNNYGGSITASMLVRSTPVLENEMELDDFVAEFDSCLEQLEREASMVLAGKKLH